MSFENSHHERVEEIELWRQIIDLSDRMISEHGHVVVPGTAEAKYEAIYGSDDFLLTLQKVNKTDSDGNQIDQYKLWAGAVSRIGKPSLKRFYQYDEGGVVCIEGTENEFAEMTELGEGDIQATEIDYFLNDAYENAVPWINPAIIALEERQ